MRRNVTQANGTGRRADVPGYEVGGKTGTAEMPARGGYRESAVIASFLAAFPMSAPRYVVLVLLFEPAPAEDTRPDHRRPQRRPRRRPDHRPHGAAARRAANRLRPTGGPAHLTQRLTSRPDAHI